LKSLRKLVAAASLYFSGEHITQAQAMVTLAFYGFLRPSEYCTDSPHSLAKTQIRLGAKHITLKFNTFKHSRQSSRIKIQCTDDPTCPVKAVRRYLLTSIYRQSDTNLFTVTATRWRKDFKEWCQAATLHVGYTPHCLRHGGATWASKQGWPDARIRAHGRWKSTAYRNYVKGF
jgi:hypothetical protein